MIEPDLNLPRLKKACCEMIAKNQETAKVEEGLSIKITSVNPSSGIGIDTSISEEGWRRRMQS
ncbi:hypothetical protein J4421_00850 [Candidatus Woesearchaeota archaeon]|nr:hypothetical protein [Candidatus Woesearchaeota archaeon]